MTKNWEAHRDHIIRLYRDEGKPLREVQRTMEEEYRFRASTRAYRTRFDRWNVWKYQRCRHRRSSNAAERPAYSGNAQSYPPDEGSDPDDDDDDDEDVVVPSAVSPVVIPGPFSAAGITRQTQPAPLRSSHARPKMESQGQHDHDTDPIYPIEASSPTFPMGQFTPVGNYGGFSSPALLPPYQVDGFPAFSAPSSPTQASPLQADARNGYGGFPMPTYREKASDHPGNPLQSNMPKGYPYQGPMYAVTSPSSQSDMQRAYGYQAAIHNPTLFVCQYLLDYCSNSHPEKPRLSCSKIAEDTGLQPDAVLSSLHELRCFVWDSDKKKKLRLNQQYCREYLERWEANAYAQADPNTMAWPGTHSIDMYRSSRG